MRDFEFLFDNRVEIAVAKFKFKGKTYTLTFKENMGFFNESDKAYRECMEHIQNRRFIQTDQGILIRSTLIECVTITTDIVDETEEKAKPKKNRKQKSLHKKKE